MHYRAEIDGLRAVAVVPVILFYANFELFKRIFLHAKWSWYHAQEPAAISETIDRIGRLPIDSEVIVNGYGPDTAAYLP